MPLKFEIPTILFNRTKEELLDLCKSSPLPGTSKYPPDHPVWDCNLAGKLSPKEAWKSEVHLKKSIDNLFSITYMSILEDKYPEFVRRIENAFKEGNLALLREIQLRFTVRKLAPKVTALMPSTFEKIIKETGIDISSGVYCPMAGFGGIIEGTKTYFKKQQITSEIEAYDINESFCNYFGWKKRNVLAQKVNTNKIVIACPPFGDKTERWKGTPENMYYDFHTWCKLIKEQISAPNYILIGPEVRTESKYASGIKASGLFAKKFGIQWYPEYTNLK